MLIPNKSSEGLRSLLSTILVLVLACNFSGCRILSYESEFNIITKLPDSTYLNLPETVTCEYQGFEPAHKREISFDKGESIMGGIRKDTYARLLFTSRDKKKYVLLIPMEKRYPYSISIWFDPSEQKEAISIHKPVDVIFNPPGEKGIKHIMSLLPPESWQGYPSKIVIYNQKNEKRIYIAYRKGPANEDIAWSIADATNLHQKPRVPGVSILSNISSITSIPFFVVAGIIAYSRPVTKDKSSSSAHSDYHPVAFSPDGNYALSAINHVIRLWDIKSGHLIHVFTGHTGDVRTVAFSPDGKYILSGSEDRTVKLWALDSGLLIRTFNGHKEQITSVAFTPNGKYILSGSWDRTMKLWDAESGNEIRTFEKKSSHFGGYTSTRINSIAISPNGFYALASNSDEELSLWELASEKIISTFLGHNERNIDAVTFSPNGKYAISAGESTMRIWEIESGWEIQKIILGSNSVAFSPDGRYILSCYGKVLLLWELETGNLIGIFKEHRGSVKSVAFNPDGHLILSGSEDQALKLWDMQSGKEIRTF